MLKKLFVSFLLLLVGTFSSALTPAQAAAPIYLNGDANYVRIDSHYDTAYYLDRSSVAVDEYNPPTYRLSANVYVVPNAAQGSTTVSVVRTLQFGYDISDRNHWQMYWSQPSSDSWNYIEPRYVYAMNGIVLPAGEMSFYIAYNMRFYGSDYPGLFPDSFYSRV
jgi:hypothetical protein